MRCSDCQHENPDPARFCGECGRPLQATVSCPSCAAANPHSSNFCHQCGESLVAGARAGPERAPSGANGERRQLTVLFCDLVGSTQLAAKLDPEDWRDVVRAYQEACEEIISRFEGHIAQHLGDGLLVYFGYPYAHEDDPTRAVSAGLAVLGDLPRLSDRLAKRYSPLRDHRLDLRVAIHTGPVVVGGMGDGDARETLALGDTVNVAARLQDVAEPGWVVISDATRRLVRGVFVLEDLGEKLLRGVAHPLAVSRVLRATGVQGRLDLAAVSGLTPLVGREQEIAFLVDRWEHVREGHGQVVLLSGEAGIGKSRLVQALRQRVAQDKHTWVECRCSAYHQNSAFRPVIELLEGMLGISAPESSSKKIARLENALQQQAFDLAKTLPLFASLLSVDLPSRYQPLTLSPEAKRRRTLESLVAWLLRLAERQPAFLVVEDLHWVDPSSLELLGMLVEQLPTVGLMIGLTFRPEFEPPWPSRSHLTHLTLDPLTRRHMEVMVAGITRGKALPALVFDQVVKKTDGVPLFVEELTKSLLESGLLAEGRDRYERTDPLPDLAIPSTLQDSLMARLDRLGPAKEVAQLAAVLGREFTFELLEAMALGDEASLASALHRLVDAELLYQRGVPPDASYIFKHALIRDTAYLSLLKSARQRHHSKIAHVLEQRFPQRVVSEPEVIARHYEEAGLAEQAISYYQRAGEQAAQRSAHAEAIGHLTRGIKLLRTLPEGVERSRKELVLQVLLGAPLQAAGGYANPEAELAYGRARKLCQQIGDAPQLSQALFGLSAFYLARGELESAVELSEQLVRLAESAGDASLLLTAHLSLGMPLYFQGRFAAARKHMEQTTALYDPSEHGSLAYVYGQDPGVLAWGYGSWALWCTGYPERSLHGIHVALELGREAAHPFGLAWALVLAGFVHHLRGEREGVFERGEETIAIATERDFPLFLGFGMVLRGWALADSPAGHAGIDEIQQGLAYLAATGTEVGGPYVLGMLAEACRDVGREDDALGAIDAALAISAARGSRFWDAELHRLKGQILLGQANGMEKDAEDLFQSALELSRNQEARSLELRAATSLGRLLRIRGQRKEAAALIEPIYSGFDEGFETKDLKQAQELLNQL